MDDQDFDPIAEALSAVSAQLTGRNPLGAAEALDAASLPYDDEEFVGDAPSDDPDADPQDLSSDDDTEAEAAEAAPAINWDDESNPYRAQAIAAQQQVQKYDLARGLFQRVQERRALEAEEADAQALVAQLEEVDPQLAQTFTGQRQGLIQRAAQAQQDMAMWQHSLAATVLAAQEVLGEETWEQIRSLGQEIVKYPQLAQMEQALTDKRQAKTSANAEVEHWKEVARQALLKAEARNRPAAADRVDSAPAARAKIARPEDADNMDDYFAALAPQLNAHFGAR